MQKIWYFSYRTYSNERNEKKSFTTFINRNKIHWWETYWITSITNKWKFYLRCYKGNLKLIKRNKKIYSIILSSK